MRRMSGQDALFLYDERPDEPQHTLKVSILGPEASAAWSFEAAKRDLAERFPSLDPFCERAVRVPLDLHHPVWVRCVPDLDHHVRRLTVPAPGGRDELCEVISEILSRPLDPARPLWEIWWLEGCAEGVVSVLKTGHAMVDGSATFRLLERLFSLEPLPRAPRDATPVPVAAETSPSRVTLIRDALRDLVRDLVGHLPALVRASFRARRRLAVARRRDEIERAPRLLRAPAMPFRGPLGQGRRFHFAPVPLQDALAVRAHLGCSVNDVVVASVAGGVRRYLQARGELPGVPTLAFLPASIRSAEEGDLWTNRVTTRFLRFPTQLADPVERVRAVARETARAKAELRMLEGAHLDDWVRWSPPFFGKGLSAAMRGLGRHNPGCVSVTSIAGPREPLHTVGGPVANFVSVGHMKYSAGMNVTTWSYAGSLNFAFYACADAVPDLGVLAGHVAAAFEELVKAADLERGRVAA